MRLSENAHLPLDKLMALSRAEGLRYPHPSGFVRASLGLPTLRAGPRFRPAAKAAGWTFSSSLSAAGFFTVPLESDRLGQRRRHKK
jgi:hypothetical protein